jgi:hypothetical protein
VCAVKPACGRAARDGGSTIAPVRFCEHDPVNSKQRESDREGGHRHVTVIHLQCAENASGFKTFFEPEGNDRFISAGDHLTICFDTAEAQEIDVAMHPEGLVIWRPTRGDVRVSIADNRTGEQITDLW